MLNTKGTDLKGRRMQSKLQTIWDTARLLYQIDRAAFLICVSTGVMESMFYPLLLLILWKGFSLLMAGGGQFQDLYSQGIVLLVALFGVLALQHLLKITNETATSMLQAASAQVINARIMSKMSEIPYRLFEENDFQARYGVLISQASYRPAMLVQTLITSVSTLVSSLAIAATLLALAPLLVVLLLALVPLTVVEARFHRQTLELQLGSAPELFRMQYLSQKSIDATWQRDIRVHNSTILDEEYRMLAQRYLGKLRRLLGRFQMIRLGVGIGVAAMVTLATGTVFWLVNRGTTGLAEAAVLLPALYLGLTEGKAFSFSWGALVECLGYIEQVFNFLNESFEQTQPAPSLLAMAEGGW